MKVKQHYHVEHFTLMDIANRQTPPALEDLIRRQDRGWLLSDGHRAGHT